MKTQIAARYSIAPVGIPGSASGRSQGSVLIKGFVWLLLIVGPLTNTAHAQHISYTWEQIRDKFELTNPTLLAGKLNIDELRAQEITAHLRPNPDFTLSTD